MAGAHTHQLCFLAGGCRVCRIDSVLDLHTLWRSGRRPGEQAEAPDCHAVGDDRSEERRVGKECRSRGLPYHLKKKKRTPYVKVQEQQIVKRSVEAKHKFALN